MLAKIYCSQLEALYQVSRVLSRSLNFHETLQRVLQVLQSTQKMSRGVVTLKDTSSGALLVGAVLGQDEGENDQVVYKPGEGIFGAIAEEGKTIVLSKLADDNRFLNRLSLYDPELPFIGVPIRIYDEIVAGVLAVQVSKEDISILDEHAHFVEMIANLIAQSVRLAIEVEKEREDLRNERDNLRRTVSRSYGFDNMVGCSEIMRRVFELIRQVAKWNTTVLVRGESGTGKELIANAVHYNSPRVNGAMVKINCAALPDDLLESELFGHEKGAFTGAINQRKGRFEQANGGTIFLDEIGDVTPAFQVKLLRVLQEGEFERVGGNETLKVDVRVIAATNRNLEELVETGEFREDLYYRLNVIPICLPPLRDRREDIPVLVDYLIDKIGKQQGREIRISQDAVRMLMQHDWPGNVRELENCLERSAIMCTDNIIGEPSLSVNLLQSEMFSRPVKAATAVDLQDETIDERERIVAALEQCGWVQAKAARLLGMTPRQIAYRIQVMDIKVRQL
ncbi:MAG: nif-specific transcriptional activator NifA [Gammaproteobacteria bacterium]|nr:MAG: nif-specific transcriptional activator NifA [Gammaproteobacteria bacterium]